MTAAEEQFVADKGLRASTQGFSVMTAGGRVPATGNALIPRQVTRALIDSLSRYRTVAAREPTSRPGPDVAADARDRDPACQPPEGGLVLYVTWKVIGDYGPTEPGA